MKEYICECGKVFTKPNSFNGHKKNCLVHMISCGKGDLLEEYAKRQRESAKRRGQRIRELNEKRKKLDRERSLQQWILEQHACEKCGKVMTEKFATGRFCSRSCANGKPHSDETKKKISKSVKDHIETCGYTSNSKGSAGQRVLFKEKLNQYNQNPDRCEICGTNLSYERRGKKCCGSKECSRKLHSLRATGNHGGGYRAGSAKNYKYGTYKDIYCDSSWELAFLVYCIENNINISRNTLLRFPYIYNNEEHFYLPDFILDDCLIEIKGRKTDEVDIKSKSVPESYNLKVLGWMEIKPYIKYVTSRYGNNFCEVLYDRNYPCYLDKKDKLDSKS